MQLSFSLPTAHQQSRLHHKALGLSYHWGLILIQISLFYQQLFEIKTGHLIPPEDV